jgi:hypothetical protein
MGPRFKSASRASKALALCGEPGDELGTPVELHAFQQISAELLTEVAELRGAGPPEAGSQQALDLECIHATIGQIEADQVLARTEHTATVRVVEHGAQLAQTPTQLTARIVWHVPQQVTQP